MKTQSHTVTFRLLYTQIIKYKNSHMFYPDKYLSERLNQKQYNNFNGSNNHIRLKLK